MTAFSGGLSSQKERGNANTAVPATAHRREGRKEIRREREMERDVPHFLRSDLNNEEV